MQENAEYTDQSLRQLLNKLPEGVPSPHFQTELMEKILCQKARRHRLNTWLTYCGIGVTCTAIIMMAIFTFRYLSINLIACFKEIIIIPDVQLSSWLPYIFIGSAALLLLLIDQGIRKLLLK